MEEKGESNRDVSCKQFVGGVQTEVSGASGECSGTKPEASRGCNLMLCGSTYLIATIPLKISPSTVMKSAVFYRAFENQLLGELQDYLHVVDREYFRLLKVEKYDISSKKEGALVKIQISEDTTSGAMSLKDISTNLLRLDDVDVIGKLSSLLRLLDLSKFDSKSVKLEETTLPSVEDILTGISATMWALIGSGIFIVLVGCYCFCRWWKTRKRGYRRHSDMDGFGGGSFMRADDGMQSMGVEMSGSSI